MRFMSCCILTAVAFSFCTRAEGPSPHPAQAHMPVGETIKIGVAGPMTGNLKEFNGMIRKGAELLFVEYPGYFWPQASVGWLCAAMMITIVG